jgi:hypothetical protein
VVGLHGCVLQRSGAILPQRRRQSIHIRAVLMFRHRWSTERVRARCRRVRLVAETAPTPIPMTDMLFKWFGGPTSESCRRRSALALTALTPVIARMRLQPRSGAEPMCQIPECRECSAAAPPC